MPWVGSPVSVRGITPVPGQFDKWITNDRTRAFPAALRNSARRHTSCPAGGWPGHWAAVAQTRAVLALTAATAVGASGAGGGSRGEPGGWRPVGDVSRAAGGSRGCQSWRVSGTPETADWSWPGLGRGKGTARPASATAARGRCRPAPPPARERLVTDLDSDRGVGLEVVIPGRVGGDPPLAAHTTKRPPPWGEQATGVTCSIPDLAPTWCRGSPGRPPGTP